MRKFLLFVMSLLRVVHLGPDGALFHRGFIFRSKLLRVFIHRFLMSDPDKEFHNHPFAWSFSLILSGSYTEERLVDGVVIRKTFSPGDINIIRPRDFHSVKLNTEDVFTLFIAGPKKTDWGFKDPETLVYTPHYEFFSGKNVKPSQDIVDID